MSDDDLKAELERLRNENCAQKRGCRRNYHESQREGLALDLRDGAFSCDALQGAMAQAPGDVR
jgi:hypothetical protein